MKPIKNIILIILIISLIFVSAEISLAKTPNEVQLVLFYGKGCPHCEREMAFLESYLEYKPTVSLSKHEVYFNNTEREYFEKMMRTYNQSIKGVPTLLIGNNIVLGFDKDTENTIKKDVEECLEYKCDNPLDRIERIDSLRVRNDSMAQNTTQTNNSDENLKNKLTIGSVVLASLVDSINPCAFAVLILLLSSIIGFKNRKKALWAGIAFSIAIFISYLLMGLGLYHAISTANSTNTIFLIVSILAITIGLFNIKDFFWYKKWFVMEVPLTWRPKMKKLLSKVKSVPGAFMIGFLISLFLLPCTSGPYIVTLGLLSKLSTFSRALVLLIVYNIIFILPMILITLAVYFGLTSTEKAENLRQKRLKTLHLIAGIILLVMGLVILYFSITGRI